MEATEVALLGLIKSYCECQVDNTKFHNSSSSCSNGTVTFSSTLAHASDDGSVNAAVIIETFETALFKVDNPTITVDGQELAVSMLADDDSNGRTYTTDRPTDTPTDSPVQQTCITDDSSKQTSATNLFIAGSSAAIVVTMVILFVIIW